MVLLMVLVTFMHTDMKLLNQKEKELKKNLKGYESEQSDESVGYLDGFGNSAEPSGNELEDQEIVDKIAAQAKMDMTKNKSSKKTKSQH
mgnify:CR=1 FL=1